LRKISREASTMFTSKKWAAAICIFFFVGILAVRPGFPGFQRQRPDPELTDLLDKAAAYADLLEGAALFFICVEKVEEWIDPSRERQAQKVARSSKRADGGWETTMVHIPAPPVINRLIYDYQCIRKAGKIAEKRILLNFNGKKVNQPDAKLQTNVFRFSTLMLGPVGLFGRRFRQHLIYTIAGKEKINSRDTVIVEAKPRRNTPETTNLFGKAWMDAESAEIVKIEWDEKYIGNRDVFLERGNKFKRTPRIRFISEFRVQKNGIRFPSRLFIEEAYIKRRGRPRPFIRSRTTIQYEQFQFFTVETEIHGVKKNENF
jgi:hypothetical protein